MQVRAEGPIFLEQRALQLELSGGHTRHVIKKRYATFYLSFSIIYECVCVCVRANVTYETLFLRGVG